MTMVGVYTACQFFLPSFHDHDGQSHDYEHYLLQCRSNLISLSTDQVAQLRASIQSTRAALKASCTDDQTDSRDELAKTLECQGSLLAPIRKLPPEILSHIFMFSVTPIYVAHPRLRSLVFRLTWTCSWWRTHVLSHPALWSSFALDWDSSTFDSYPAEQRAFIKECISRSGDYTRLNLTLSKVRDIRGWSYLLGQVKRLETLNLQPYYGWDLKVIHTELDRLFKRLHKKAAAEGSSKMFFPRLENLTLAIPGHLNKHTLWRAVPLDDLFAECPSLHTLRINLLRQTDPIDFSHMTNLRVGGFYLGRSFSGLLAKCPILETFSVDRFRVIDGDSSSFSYVPTPMHHTKLTTRRITWLDRHCISGFWTGVRLPNLACLVASVKGYQTADGIVPGLLGELKDMVVKSRCTLEKLRLGRSLPNIAVESFLEGLSFTSGADVVVNGKVYVLDVL